MAKRHVAKEFCKGFEPLVWFDPFKFPQVIDGKLEGEFTQDKKKRSGEKYKKRVFKIRIKKSEPCMGIAQGALLEKFLDTVPIGGKVHIEYNGMQSKETKQMMPKTIKTFKAMGKWAGKDGCWPVWGSLFG